MKLPLAPPSLRELIAALPPETLPTLLEHAQPALADGHYLHWDELRHRTPPRHLNSEEWWLGIKMARTTGWT